MGTSWATSEFPGSPGAVVPISFGGNSSLDQQHSSRMDVGDDTSTTRFYVSARTSHRVQLSADSRIDGFQQSGAGNSRGTFSFNSLIGCLGERTERVHLHVERAEYFGQSVERIRIAGRLLAEVADTSGPRRRGSKRIGSSATPSTTLRSTDYSAPAPIRRQAEFT